MAQSFKTTMAPLTAQNVWKRKRRQIQCEEKRRGISEVLTITSVSPLLLKGNACTVKPEDGDSKFPKCNPKLSERNEVRFSHHEASKPLKSEPEPHNQAAMFLSCDGGFSRGIPRDFVKRYPQTDPKIPHQNNQGVLRNSNQVETKTSGQFCPTARSTSHGRPSALISGPSVYGSKGSSENQGSDRVRRPPGLSCAGFKVLALHRLTRPLHRADRLKDNTKESKSDGTTDNTEQGVDNLETLSLRRTLESNIVERWPSQPLSNGNQKRISIRDALPLLLTKQKSDVKDTNYKVNKKYTDSLLVSQEEDTGKTAGNVVQSPGTSNSILVNSINANKTWVNPVRSVQSQSETEPSDGKIVECYSNTAPCPSNPPTTQAAKVGIDNIIANSPDAPNTTSKPTCLTAVEDKTPRCTEVSFDDKADVAVVTTYTAGHVSRVTKEIPSTPEKYGSTKKGPLDRERLSTSSLDPRIHSSNRLSTKREYNFGSIECHGGVMKSPEQNVKMEHKLDDVVESKCIPGNSKENSQVKDVITNTLSTTSAGTETVLRRFVETRPPLETIEEATQLTVTEEARTIPSTVEEVKEKVVNTEEIKASLVHDKLTKPTPKLTEGTNNTPVTGTETKNIPVCSTGKETFSTTIPDINHDQADLETARKGPDDSQEVKNVPLNSEDFKTIWNFPTVNKDSVDSVAQPRKNPKTPAHKECNSVDNETKDHTLTSAVTSTKTSVSPTNGSNEAKGHTVDAHRHQEDSGLSGDKLLQNKQLLPTHFSKPSLTKEMTCPDVNIEEPGTLPTTPSATHCGQDKQMKDHCTHTKATTAKNTETHSAISEQTAENISDSKYVPASVVGNTVLPAVHKETERFTENVADTKVALFPKQDTENISVDSPEDAKSKRASDKDSLEAKGVDAETVSTSDEENKLITERPKMLTNCQPNAFNSGNTAAKPSDTQEVQVNPRDSNLVSTGHIPRGLVQTENTEAKADECVGNVQEKDLKNTKNLLSLIETNKASTSSNSDHTPLNSVDGKDMIVQADSSTSEEEDSIHPALGENVSENSGGNSATASDDKQTRRNAEAAAVPHAEKSVSKATSHTDHAKIDSNSHNNSPIENSNTPNSVASTSDPSGNDETKNPNNIKTENDVPEEQNAHSSTKTKPKSSPSDSLQEVSTKTTQRKETSPVDDVDRSQTKKRIDRPNYTVSRKTVAVYSQKLSRSLASGKTPTAAGLKEEPNQRTPPSWARVRSAQPQVFRTVAKMASRISQKRSKSVMDMAGNQEPAPRCHCQRRLPGAGDVSCQCDEAESPDSGTKTNVDRQAKWFTMLWEECLVNKKMDKARNFLKQMPLPQRQQLVHEVSKNCSMLGACCRMGNLQMVEFLLDECGADIDQKEAYEDFTHSATNPTIHKDVTPLWCAAVEGQVHVVSALIKRGADIHAKTANGSSAIRSACYKLHVPVVEALLKAGVDVHSPNINGVTCLMNGCNSPEMCHLLLRHGACANDRDSSGNTALHYAAAVGQLQSLRLLVQYGGKVSERNEAGNTVLRCAGLRGWMHIIDYLAHCSSANIVGVIESYELAGCTLVDLGDSEDFFKVGVSAWQKALHLRHISGVPKTHLRQDKIAPFQFQLEFTTLREVDHIALDPDEARVQSLLIRERICGSKHEELILALISRGKTYMERGLYRLCLDVWSHAFRLRLDSSRGMQKNVDSTPQKIVKLFLELCLQKVKDNNEEEVLRVSDTLDTLQLLVEGLHRTTIQENIKSSRQRHRNIKDTKHERPNRSRERTLDGIFFLHVEMALHLIRIIATYQKLSPGELERFYSLVYQLVKADYRSVSGESLLHLCFPLSELDTDVNDQRAPTTELLGTLIQCGADVDAVNDLGESPLFYVLNSVPGRDAAFLKKHPDKESWVQMLLRHQAHADRVSDERRGIFKSLKQLDSFCPLNYVNLQCLAARVIKDCGLLYRDPYTLPSHLISFVDYH